MSRRSLAALLLVALIAPTPFVRGDDPAPDTGPTCAEAVIAAPRSKAWAAMTTKAGLEAWCVKHASMDLRVGGSMKTVYDAAAKIGDPSTIENEIIAFDPERMLALKVKTPPRGFPFPNAVKSMWTVTYFEDAGDGKTKVTCRGLGYGADPESQKMRAFFARGNAHTLAQMKKHLEAAE